MEKIKFLGIGSAFNPLWGNNAAYYIRNNKLLLIDCGETNFERILRKNILEDISQVYILITHLHPDHVGSLGSLIFYLKFMKNIEAKVLFEDKESIKVLLNLMGVQDEDYKLCEEFLVEELRGIGIRNIETYSVNHSNKLKSYGYKIIFEDNEVIFYTGDCKEISNEVINQVLKNEIHKLYIDCFPIDISGVPHITVAKMCEIFPEYCRNRIYGMHYDGENVIKLLKENKFRCVKVD